jgi:molecular chaperone HscB
MAFESEALGRDFFALFGLPRRFALDVAELEVLYRDMQARVHPDKFASAGEADKRLAMQLATHANEAYLTLKSPLKRGQYLLQLAGHDPQIEHNTAMPTDFLVEQMEWREAVAGARRPMPASWTAFITACARKSRSSMMPCTGRSTKAATTTPAPPSWYAS